MLSRRTAWKQQDVRQLTRGNTNRYGESDNGERSQQWRRCEIRVAVHVSTEPRCQNRSVATLCATVADVCDAAIRSTPVSAIQQSTQAYHYPPLPL